MACQMMEKFLPALSKVFEQANQWLSKHVLSSDSAIQIGILIGVFFLMLINRNLLNSVIENQNFPSRIARYEKRVKGIVAPLFLPSLAIIILWFSVFALSKAEIDNQLINIVVSLLSAWVVIRLVSGAIEDSTWSKMVSLIVWMVAALNIVGLLEVTNQFFGAISFSLGSLTFSVLGLFKGIIAIALMFWLFSLFERFLQRKIGTLSNITPSAKVLLNKFLRISLVVLAILISLDAVGIDLTALAVFSGAIGIGLGFGLQKVASNLVSGVILLLDRSVKPGDVISLGNTYGKIDKLGGRYVSVITRDGTEHLIPNEELITQRVENWSFSDTNVRQRALISIDYNSDINLAMTLCEEACVEVARVVNDPKARCLLRDFADNGIHIEIRYWVNDAQNGLGSVRSDLLKVVWAKFKENDINFPYPQRDLHIKGTVPVSIEN